MLNEGLYNKSIRKYNSTFSTKMIKPRKIRTFGAIDEVSEIK